VLCEALANIDLRPRVRRRRPPPWGKAAFVRARAVEGVKLKEKVKAVMHDFAVAAALAVVAVVAPWVEKVVHCCRLREDR
jgi:hypothetical protein